MSIFPSKPLKLDNQYRFSHDLPDQSVPVAITDAECIERNRESHAERTEAKRAFADAETAVAAAKEAHKKAKSAHDTAIAKADIKQAQAATATKPIESAVAVYAFYPDAGEPEWVQVRTDPGYEGVEHGERVPLTEKEMRKLSQQPLPLQDTPPAATQGVVLDITEDTLTLVVASGASPDTGPNVFEGWRQKIRDILIEHGPLTIAALHKYFPDAHRSQLKHELDAMRDDGTAAFRKKKWEAVVPVVAIGADITDLLAKGPLTTEELADELGIIDLEVGKVLGVMGDDDAVVINDDGRWRLP